MSKAQGQITITDFNDAITLTGFINSNLQKTQMYNPDNGSYTPDWSTTNLVLTPSLFVAGTTTDKITATEVQNVKWYEDDNSTAIIDGGNYALSGSKNHVLTVKANVMAGLSGKDFRCEIEYLDATTKLTLKYVMSISFARVVNGSGITDLIVSTPDGNVFKNNEVASLKAKAELWRGSVIDTTNVAYQWYMLDTSVETDQGGGIGYRKLTDSAGNYTGTTTATITLYANAVDSYTTLKCVAKDTDSASNTYNESFVDTASFIDNSDPLQVIIQSSGGDVFKNSVGSTVLTAKCYQGGEEVDTEGAGTYVWSKYDKDGEKVTAFKKTGKTLSVGSADVATKATFIVEVTL